MIAKTVRLTPAGPGWVVVGDELIGFLNSLPSVVLKSHLPLEIYNIWFFSHKVSDISKFGIGVLKAQPIPTSKDISVANPPIIHPESQILIRNAISSKSWCVWSRLSFVPPSNRHQLPQFFFKGHYYVCICFCHILHITPRSWLILLGSIPT